MQSRPLNRPSTSEDPMPPKRPLPAPSPSFALEADLLRALAHPLRLHLLAALSLRPASVSELCAALGKAQAAVSQQLALLRGRGIVAARREGTRVVYRLDHPLAEALLRVLAKSRARLAPSAPARTAASPAAAASSPSADRAGRNR